VYVAVPFAVWHYLWLDRDIITIPVLYAVLISALLALRLPVVRHVLRRILPGRR
jgi:DMSO/TMAO reductase YedYZ heme-binding membrane subunit